MAYIKNDKELERFLQTMLMNTLSVVTKDLLKMLQDQIDIDTYRGSWYTGEFKDAWQWEDIKPLLGAYVQQLFYDYSNSTRKVKHPMRYEQVSYGNHSSIEAQDMRPFMDKILNVKGKTSKYGVVEREPYWNNFVDEVDISIYQMILDELEKLGILNNFTVKMSGHK